MYNKSPLVVLAIGMLLALGSAPATAVDNPLDGVTASITFDSSVGDLVLFADEDGGYTATVSIFQKLDGEWEPVAMQATLRVFEDNLFGNIDRESIPFTSSATGSVDVTFPGDDLTGGTLDVFVTFSQLSTPGESTPTSHHHVAKNLVIEQGDYDTADSLDHHSTRVVAL